MILNNIVFKTDYAIYTIVGDYGHNNNPSVVEIPLVGNKIPTSAPFYQSGEGGTSTEFLDLVHILKSPRNYKRFIYNEYCSHVVSGNNVYISDGFGTIWRMELNFNGSLKREAEFGNKIAIYEMDFLKTTPEMQVNEPLIAGGFYKSDNRIYWIGGMSYLDRFIDEHWNRSRLSNDKVFYVDLDEEGNILEGSGWIYSGIDIVKGRGIKEVTTHVLGNALYINHYSDNGFVYDELIVVKLDRFGNLTDKMSVVTIDGSVGGLSKNQDITTILTYNNLLLVHFINNACMDSSTGFGLLVLSPEPNDMSVLYEKGWVGWDSLYDYIDTHPNMDYDDWIYTVNFQGQLGRAIIDTGVNGELYYMYFYQDSLIVTKLDLQSSGSDVVLSLNLCSLLPDYTEQPEEPVLGFDDIDVNSLPQEYYMAPTGSFKPFKVVGTTSGKVASSKTVTKAGTKYYGIIEWL